MESFVLAQSYAENAKNNIDVGILYLSMAYLYMDIFDYETAKKFYREAIFDRVTKIEQNIREELRAIEELCVKLGTSEAAEFYVDEYYDGRK